MTTYTPEQRKAMKLAKLAQMSADPSDRRHGTPHGYDYGCRCPKCTEAHAEKCRGWRLTERQKKRLRKLKESAKPATVWIHGLGREVRI